MLDIVFKRVNIFQLCAIDDIAWLSRDTVWSRLEDICLPEADCQVKHLGCFGKSDDSCLEVILLMGNEGKVISKQHFGNKSLQDLCFCCKT